MSRFPWQASLWLVTFFTVLTAVPLAQAQRDPQIGYVYPAGGRPEADVEVTVGGQYLNGVTDAYVSGEGVQAEVIRYIKPLTQQQLNQLRQKLRELQRRLAAATRSGAKRRPGGGPVPPDTVRRIAQELGLEATTMKALAELRQKVFNPRKQLNPQLAEVVLLRVKVARDARPGERELRLRTAAGVSSPIFFHVGQWPEIRENEPNDRPVDNEIPELPATVNGQILPGDIDRFRFTARKGEHLVVAASARKLIPYLADAVPGWFQATVALYDARGDEVAYADDYRFHPDPVLYYEVPEDGAYVLEIRDALYRGREDFVYRIAVGEIPFVTSIFPLGGRVGEATTVEVSGWNLPVSETIMNAEDSPAGIQPLSLRGDGWINCVPFALDTLPECLDVEPNDEPRSAQWVELPKIVNGRIDHPGDWDVFRLEGSAGDEIVAEVTARRLDSPLDSLLKLTDAEGRLLAANDDHEDKGAGLTTHHADSELRFTIPKDGPYYLFLGDAQNQGGSACGYRLRIGPRRPDFELRVVPSSLNARGGATVPINVYALRKDGFDDDIALELEDAPPGCTLSGGWVPAHQDKVRLTLTLPAGPRKAPLNLSLKGRAVIQGREVCRRAVPADDRMQAFIYRHLVPAKDWIVSVTGRGRTRASVNVLGETPVRLPAAGTARVRMSAPRGALLQQVRLQLNEPPEGIAIRDVSTDREGLVILLSAEGGKVEPGLKGNLIVDVFTERTTKARNAQGKVRKRRVALGTLPAIPFEIVELVQP